MSKINKILKVCILSDSFIPKKISAAGMLYNLSLEFVSRDVEVICVFGSDKSETWKIEDNKSNSYDLEKIKIISSNFMSNFRYKNNYLRFIFELVLAFSLSIKIIRYKKLFKNVDLIVWYSPSAFLWLPALILKKITGSNVYLILRDIFPDWLINLGILKNNLTINLLKLLTYPQFKIPDIIGCESIKDTKLIKKKVKDKKVETLYNWPSIPSGSMGFEIHKKINFIDFSKKNKRAKKLFSVYTGNDSLSHDLNSGINYLRNFLTNNQVEKELFLNRFTSNFIPAKPSKHLIEKKWDMVSENLLPYIYKHVDFGIVSLNINHVTNNLPGKFISYIQFGLPVMCFASLESELAKMVLSSHCGCVIDISNSKENNNKILLNFFKNFNLNKKEYSENSLKLFHHYFSLDKVVKQLINR
jgi:hypothetical protein